MKVKTGWVTSWCVWNRRPAMAICSAINVEDALVGVDAQHPVVRHQIQRLIAELPEARKVALIDLVRVFPADLLSPVGAVGVQDDDLVGPGEALEGTTDLPFLVERQDVSRELRHGPPERAARAPATG